MANASGNEGLPPISADNMPNVKSMNSSIANVTTTQLVASEKLPMTLASAMIEISPDLSQKVEVAGGKKLFQDAVLSSMNMGEAFPTRDDSVASSPKAVRGTTTNTNIGIA